MAVLTALAGGLLLLRRAQAKKNEVILVPPWAREERRVEGSRNAGSSSRKHVDNRGYVLGARLSTTDET